MFLGCLCPAKIFYASGLFVITGIIIACYDRILIVEEDDRLGNGFISW
jgi:hypothetical protein